MIYNDWIDVSKGIDINKTGTSKACIICSYWHFLEKGFKFQSSVCNGCHDVLMFIDINSIAILNIHGVNYCCIIVVFLLVKRVLNTLFATKMMKTLSN